MRALVGLVLAPVFSPKPALRYVALELRFGNSDDKAISLYGVAKLGAGGGDALRIGLRLRTFLLKLALKNGTEDEYINAMKARYGGEW